MSNLATILEELTETAGTLAECGESLIRAAASLQALFSTGTDDTPAPAAAATPPAQPGRKGTLPKAGRQPAAARREVHIPEPTEAQVPKSPTDPPVPTYTREQVRAMLADLALSGRREEAKALVNKYANGGSFSAIDPASYPELAQEVQKYHYSIK